jgi:hypothetical protein
MIFSHSPWGLIRLSSPGAMAHRRQKALYKSALSA